MIRLLALLLLVGSPGCALLDGSGQADVFVFSRQRLVTSQSPEVFAEVRARWDEVQRGDYTFTYATVCLCPGQPPLWTVVVREGVVVDYSPETGIREFIPPTMDGLYATVEAALTEGRSIEFHYDPATRLLAGYTVNPELMATDGGYALYVERLVLHR